jgi:hypothetical protein
MEFIMTVNKIPFISGFQHLRFNNGNVPSPKVFAEMLKPGSSLAPSTLVQVDLDNAQEISNFSSQLLLQKYSNHVVSQLCEDVSLKPICDASNWDFNEVCYHDYMIHYINYFFAKMPSLTRNKKNGLQLKSTTCKYFRCLSPESKEMFDKAKELQRMIGSVDSEIEEIIQQKFADYRIAKDFMLNFYLKAIQENPTGFNELIDEMNSVVDISFVKRLSKYRLLKDTRPPSDQRLLQCPYCSCWFEVSIGGNGKLRLHCGQKSCKQAWDRLRKINKKL